MAIIAKASGDGGRDFEPAPAGTHQAVCVDVIDKGMVPNTFKAGALQHKVSIAWQITELRDDGKPFLVYKRYTLSLNEKATLRHDLESWRGKAFTRDEEMGFDVESVIGANCLLNIAHAPKGDKVYANVVSVMPLMRGMPKIAATGYVREVEAQKADNNSTDAPDATNITDDYIPF